MALPAQPGLLRGAVEGDHRPVDAGLVDGVEAAQAAPDLAVDGRQRGVDAVAAQPLAAIAPVERFPAAGGGSGRSDGAAGGAAFEGDFDLDGGAAARVPDLAAEDGPDS